MYYYKSLYERANITNDLINYYVKKTINKIVHDLNENVCINKIINTHEY